LKAQIRSELIDQAGSGWIGIVVLGKHTTASGPVSLSWYWNPNTLLFVSENAAVLGNKTFDQMWNDAQSGAAELVFLGVPPGNERRIGSDVDNDGSSTGAELTNGTDPWSPDSDGDGWLDGYEVANGGNPLSASSAPVDTTPPALVGAIEFDFASASAAKFFLKANEPVRVSISAQTANAPMHTNQRATFDKTHTAVVQKLEASTFGSVQTPPAQSTIHTNSFTGSITLTDMSGNSTVVPLPAFQTLSMEHKTAAGAYQHVVVGDLALSNELRILTLPSGSSSAYQARIDARVDFREEAPPFVPAQNQVIIGQLLKEGALAGTWDIIPAADILSHTGSNQASLDFLYGGTSYANDPKGLPGPFLVCDATDANGLTHIEFQVTNLGPTQKVRFNVVNVLQPDANYDPHAPAFGNNGMPFFFLPATKIVHRNKTSTL